MWGRVGKLNQLMSDHQGALNELFNRVGYDFTYWVGISGYSVFKYFLNIKPNLLISQKKIILCCLKKHLLSWIVSFSGKGWKNSFENDISVNQGNASQKRTVIKLGKLLYVKTWKKSISKFHFPVKLLEIRKNVIIKIIN